MSRLVCHRGHSRMWKCWRRNCKLLCRRLSLIGGADLKITVWRLLQAVMTNALACHYNWAGRGGVKRAISGLALSSHL
ncbi:hypothetical protein AOLI_G00001700 [Acnodon oligacanthus]